MQNQTAEPRTSVPQTGPTGSLEVLKVTDLLSLAAAGNSQAFAELYQRYWGMVLWVAFGILGNRQDAEEVSQEAFLYAWTRAKDYNPSLSSVSTWLLLITRSRCLDRLRTRQVSRKAHWRLQWEATTATYSSPGSFAHALGRERADRVREAIDGLPTTQREVIDLCFYRGLSQSEAAAQTGIPLGTIKTRTLLAKKRLHGDLAGEIRQLMS